MSVVSSRAFPDLVVTSTVRVNMGTLLVRLFLDRRQFEGYRSKLTGCGGGSLGWNRSCDQLLDHHVFGPKPSSETGVRSYEFQLPECPRGSGPLRSRVRGRFIREGDRSFGCGQWRHLEAKPRGTSVNDRFWCSARTQFSRALFRRDDGKGRPALLDVLAAAMRAHDLALLVVDER